MANRGNWDTGREGERERRDVRYDGRREERRDGYHSAGREYHQEDVRESIRDRGYGSGEHRRRAPPTYFECGQVGHYRNQCWRLTGEGSSRQGEACLQPRNAAGEASPERVKLKRQIQDLGASIASMQGHIKAENLKKAEQLKQAEDEQRAREKKAAKKQAKLRKAEEFRMQMRKEMRMEAAQVARELRDVVCEDWRAQIKEELRHKKKTSPPRYTPRRGTPRTKIAATLGTVGKAKFICENIRVLAEFGADELKEICRKEDVEYGNKTVAATNIAEKRAAEAYDTSNQEIAEREREAEGIDQEDIDEGFVDAGSVVYILASPTCKALYVGKTCKDVDVRWREHISRCDRRSKDTHLYRWWQCFGKESYVLLSVETCRDEELIAFKQLYIHRWNPALNTNGLRRKRNRRNKKQRGKRERQRGQHGLISEQKGRSQIPVKIQVNEGAENVNVFNALTELEKRRTRKFTLRSAGGNTWTDGWKKICRAFGTTPVKWEGTVKTLSKSKKELEDGGTCTVQYLRRWHPKGKQDKHELIKILRNPAKTEVLRGKDATVLFRLYRGAKGFQKKSTRCYLRRLLSRTIKETTGWIMGADVCVKMRFDDRVKLGEVRKLANDKLMGLELPTCMTRRARSKLKIVWTSNPAVSDLLHNQKMFARADVCTCTCAGLPYPRIGDHVRFQLQELGDIHPMLCNAKNVPRVSCPDISMLLKKEIEEAFDKWPNRGEKRVHILRSEAEGCMMSGSDTETNWLEVDDVREVKERMSGLVCTPLDRNTGETFVLCPLVYHEAMMTTFVCNTGYRIMDKDEAAIFAEMKVDLVGFGLKRFVKMEKQGVIGNAYVQPKHKDLDRFRPICPSYCEPIVKTSRLVAKALNHLLFALPEAWHFNMKAVSDIVPRINKMNKKIQQRRSEGCHVSSMSYDIKDMFSKLPHEKIIEAVDWIIRHFISKGKTAVRVNPRGRGSSFGRTTGADHWRTIELETLRRFVEFDLKHTYIKATGVILKQLIGIPMGKSTSLPLACIMCAHAEWKFLQGWGRKELTCSVRG
ncbi:hypothetical protein CBR_g31504 [Chara braunii]|uniref:GIY-YIG domain-containing protein n=1 Tax=Chara braunii TaxID=69332 RepID=A0A388LFB0_CHABU|nr:hypothetical protein CBR_g31504 [Chara braunii]|eukprot:GBG80947.1 hypothetical protein CBR_g31504 [Chara braunii]